MAEDWRSQTMAQIEAMLETLPEPSPAEGESDLCSIFEQLTVIAQEQKTFQRKAASSLKTIEHDLHDLSKDQPMMREVLEHMAKQVSTSCDELKQIKECLKRQQTGDQLDARWSLPMTMLGRLERLAEQMSQHPKATFWAGKRRWSEAWASAEQAVDIVLHHLLASMEEHGLKRMEVLGKAFDPRTMMAIGQRVGSGVEEGCVLEEVSPGFISEGQVIRPAEVIVLKGSTA